MIQIDEHFLEKVCEGFWRYYEKKHLRVVGTSMPGPWKDLDSNIKQQTREAMDYAWKHAIGSINEQEDEPQAPEPKTA